jgi:ribosomal protein S27E
MSDEMIIDTSGSATDGQTKCPKCGATDISTNESTGMLRCNFCRYTFQPEVLEDMQSGVGDLSGEQIGSGAVDIDEQAETMVTMKCTSCGAEVVVNMNESTQARCHWCRNMLSINSKVPNGAVPDVILPFKMKREEAKELIEGFVGKRKFYANKVFRKEFSTENVMGVYFPYMLVDMKGHATFEGVGEHEKSRRTVTRKSGDREIRETIYRVQSYKVQRECDVEIDDLAVEASVRRAGASVENETNNIINAILPFDTENCVKFDSNYLNGYTSEKRDVNKDELQGIVDSQEREATKFALNPSVEKYDRGVNWTHAEVTKDGEKWLSTYLPVWLYSYVENPGTSKQLTHYVAVNARTKETTGSVPLNKGRLIFFTALIGLLTLLATSFLCLNSTAESDIESLFLLLAPPIVASVAFFWMIYSRYRNTGARHHFESETKIHISNIQADDEMIRVFETENSHFSEANNTKVTVEHLSRRA